MLTVTACLRSLPLLAAGGLATILGSALPPAPPAALPGAVAPSHDTRVIGVWFITTYLGDPSDPTTPTVQGAVTLHSDQTAQLTASDHTGTHPVFPGLATPATGTWAPTARGIEFRLFEFNNGPNPPGTFGVLRIAASAGFDGVDRMTGTAGFDVVSCPSGAAGCLHPNATPFPPANALPFEMVRFR